MSRNANAYGAVDSPSMLTAAMIRSAMPFGRRAASAATTTDSATETTSAYSSSSMVIGTWIASSWLTLAPWSVVPKFPCSTLTSQCQYRCQKGWSRPSVWLSAATAEGLAFSPSIAWAESFGSRLITENVRKVTPMSTGMAASSRRPATRSAGEPVTRRARSRAPASRWSWICWTSAMCYLTLLVGPAGQEDDGL